MSVDYVDAKGDAHKAVFDRLIISIGRVPNTIGLNAEVVGLALDERGFIAVDGDCRTSLPNVWAVGDVVRGPMLAHKAEEEGVAVAERIAGQHGHVNFNTVPWVIYTSPEIAWVGKTEQQLKAEGVAYKAGTFPFMANGRARALGDTSGMVKFLADAKSDEILGVHIIGPMASELIAEAVVAMEFRASAEDIAHLVGRPVEEVQDILALSEHATSLDAPLDNDPQSSLMDMLPGASEDSPDARAEHHEMTVLVRDWLTKLPDKQRVVIMRRFGLDNDDPATLETLAEEMGVTRERVRQIQQEALIKLKRAMAARGVVRDSLL